MTSRRIAAAAFAAVALAFSSHLAAPLAAGSWPPVAPSPGPLVTRDRAGETLPDRRLLLVFALAAVAVLAIGSVLGRRRANHTA